MKRICSKERKRKRNTSMNAKATAAAPPEKPLTKKSETRSLRAQRTRKTNFEKSAFGEEWNNIFIYNEVPSGKDLCENLNIYL